MGLKYTVFVVFLRAFCYDQQYLCVCRAFHYRDFVIGALNQDMPFDQFVRWQIVGDELAPEDPEAHAATGFLGAGMTRMGFPCVGSWITYGLGTENQSLPSFVVMSDPLDRGLPKGYVQNWGAGFLPGVFQGTWLRPKGEPIPNLKR